MRGKQQSMIEPLDEAVDHVRGSKTGRLIVEYGDYECPYCRDVDPATRDLLLSRPDVRYAWRHLPLSDIHPHARLAAEAAKPVVSLWQLRQRQV